MEGIRVLGRLATLTAFLLTGTTAHGMDFGSWGDALRNGQPIVDARYRLETVDQDNALRDARASTLRARLGFASDTERPLSAVVEAESVIAIGSDRYNSTTNGRTDYAVVIDPEETEINQAYLTLSLDKTSLSVGRRRMVFDNGRFLGNVGFRQNEQTYDAVVLMNTSLPGHRFMYAYMDKAHRFLSDDSPAGNLDMSSHFINYRHQWLNSNALVLYAYLLEMDPAAIQGRSTRTLGARFSGGFDVGATRLLYTLEYADQSPYANGLDTNEADYLFAEIGARFANQWVVKIASETLGGDGIYGFQTQLATAHAFAGDADIFAAATPANGLVDRYARFSAPFGSLKLSVTWHDFVSDNDSIDYGTEWDAGVTAGFGERVTIGAQFARYRADQFAVDTDKTWLWVQYRY